MNEQQNIALIQRMYAAFAKGDVQTILDNVTDDVDWSMEAPSIIPYAGKKKGRAQVGEFFQALGTTQTNVKLTTESFVAQGDQVATLGRYVATVKATGLKMDSPIGHFFTIRDGKVSRFVNFGDTAAVAAAYTAKSASA